MEKKLVSAYDRMIMPDGCSRRIEEALRQKAEQPKGQYTVILGKENRRKAWRSSFAAMCLAILLLVGGTTVFIKTMGWLRGSGETPAAMSSPSESTAAEATIADDDTPFPFGAEAERFLMDMCRFMPDWNGTSSLDDWFWQEFLYNSFSDVKKTEGMMVDTIIGQVPCLGGMVMLPREQAQEYAMLATGQELPEFTVDDPEGTAGIAYADGCYRIRPKADSTVKLENVTLEIVREDCTWKDSEDGEFFSADYRVSARRDGTALSTHYVSFYLRRAENRNGFVILAKITNQDLYKMENQEIETVARAFGEACFANDTETMRSLMSSRDSWDLLSSMEISGDNSMDDQRFEVTDVSVYRGLLETLGGNPVACVHYRYTLPGSTEFLDPGLGVFLEMEDSREGWKVRHFETKALETVFVDGDRLRDVVKKFMEAYLTGDKDGVRALMREGTTRDVLVYEGDPEAVTSSYYRIMGVNPGTVPEAEVQICYGTPTYYDGETGEVTEQGREHEILRVKLVRLEDSWVVDSWIETISPLGSTTENDGEG